MPVRILEVHQREGEVFHLASEPLEPGTRIFGEINWSRRFSFMQHHSGEHLVSGLVHKLFGFDNVGFHMGHEGVTLDFNGALSQEDVDHVEDLANEAVWNDVASRVEYPETKALESLAYRSKKELEGPVRIVSFPGYDVCACCGTHVARTGEIGVIKILSSQRYKGGVRLTMLCGRKALEDYRQKNEHVAKIAAGFSVKTGQVLEGVARLQEENAALRQKLAAANRRMMEEKAALVPEGSPLACFFEELEPGELGKFWTLLEGRAKVAAVFARQPGGRFQYALGSSAVDVR